MLKLFSITFVANPRIMVKFNTDRMEFAEKIMNIVSKPNRQTLQMRKKIVKMFPVQQAPIYSISYCVPKLCRHDESM